MGIVYCPRHGRQNLNFASPTIARAINGQSVVAAGTVYGLKLASFEIWWVCLVDGDFLVQNAIEVPTSTCVIVVEDEERVDELLQGMHATCCACCSEYLSSNDELREMAAVPHPRLPNSSGRR
jgi:hypothetical protein